MSTAKDFLHGAPRKFSDFVWLLARSWSKWFLSTLWSTQSEILIIVIFEFVRNSSLTIMSFWPRPAEIVQSKVASLPIGVEAFLTLALRSKMSEKYWKKSFKYAFSTAFPLHSLSIKINVLIIFLCYLEGQSIIFKDKNIFKTCLI